MKKEGMTFPEALQVVSKRAGIELPKEHLSPEEKHRVSERENLLIVNRLALDHFRKSLQGESGKSARAYLEKRGFTGDILDRFLIGFALDGWDGLARYFKGRNVPINLAEKLGLLKPRQEGNGHYDGFRNRVMFPIVDLGNRLIGFGGRVMDDALPKYLNSPESSLYNKRRCLYGAHAARNESRVNGLVYVVEGYFDVLALHRDKICNSVATLGTSLTSEHIQLLKSLIGANGHVVLVYDSDNAGIKAAERSIDLFSAGFVDARILVLPEGHDPDSFLLEFGADAFLKAASLALPVIPFLMETAVRRYGLSTDGKVRIVSELKGPLAAVEDGMTRALHVRDLAERIGIDEAAVMEKVKSHSAESSFRPSRDPTIGDSSDRRVGKETGPLKRHTRLEQRLIAMILQYPDMLMEVKRRNLLHLFENTQLRAIGEAALEHGMAAAEKRLPIAADIMANIPDSRMRAMAASLAIGDDPWDYSGCLKLMDQFEGSRKRSDKNILLQIRAAEKAGDFELLTQLLKKKQALANR